MHLESRFTAENNGEIPELIQEPRFPPSPFPRALPKVSLALAQPPLQAVQVPKFPLGFCCWFGGQPRTPPPRQSRVAGNRADPLRGSNPPCFQFSHLTKHHCALNLTSKLDWKQLKVKKVNKTNQTLLTVQAERSNRVKRDSRSAWGEATSLRLLITLKRNPLKQKGQHATLSEQKKGVFLCSHSVETPLLVEGKSFSSYVNLSKRSVKFLMWTPLLEQKQLRQHLWF